MTYTIGITGGIGSGKSTVSDYLRDRGFFIIDADSISRRMTGDGSPVLDDIAREFGNELVTCGHLDRKALADIVFSDPEKKKKLEGLITLPVCREIRQMLHSEKEAGTKPLVFLDAPLLFEFGLDKDVEESWLIYSDMETRIRRVMDRDSCREEDVRQRILAQMPDEEKMAMADLTIDNSGLPEVTFAQVDRRIEYLTNCN